MRAKGGSKAAAGTVIEMPDRPAQGRSDVEAARQQSNRSSKGGSSSITTRTGSTSQHHHHHHHHHHPHHHDTYGNPRFPGPYTAHSTIEPDHEANDALPRGGNEGGGSWSSGMFHQDMICGVRRQMFWMIIATGAFAMIATVAIGVGLGVALRKAGGDPP